MLIRLAYDIQFDLYADTPMIALLHVHPSRVRDLLQPDELLTEPKLEVTSYLDTFGNRCARFMAPSGHLRLSSSTVIQQPDTPDEVNWSASQFPVQDLPNEMLRFLLSSRYCEVDLLSSMPSATGSTTGLSSTINRRGPPRRPWRCTRSA